MAEEPARLPWEDDDPIRGKWARVVQAARHARMSSWIIVLLMITNILVSTITLIVVSRQSTTMAAVNEIADRNSRAAASSADTAAESLHQTVRALALAERAWLMPIATGDPLRDIKLVAGQAVKIPVTIQNAGKTPARYVTVVSASSMEAVDRSESDAAAAEQSFEHQIDKAAKDERWPKTWLLAPGQSDVFLVPARFTQAEIEEFRTGGLGIHVYGRIAYQDIAPHGGVDRLTKFCFVLRRSAPLMNSCQFHNDAR